MDISATRKLVGGMAVVIAILTALPARGGTYYVSPEGTPQGDGTREKPFSVAHVLAAVKLPPGDEVVFLDGVYKGGLNIGSVGNDKASITYRAENRHKAILDGGTPLTGWTKVAGEEAVWECRTDQAPATRLMVDGDGLLESNSPWRRDDKTTLEEGMFAVERVGKEAVVRMRPWGGREPKEVYALMPRLVNIAGAFNVMDGFLVRRAVDGIHVAGRQVHVYKPTGLWLEISGLGNNAFGSFNVLRNCVVRDMLGQGLTSNESRFNLIEDNVIYNAGLGQGDHGIYISQGGENLTLRRNVWWRTSGGAIHIYSGTGIDSPRGIVAEYNIFGPDKRNRCFPLANRKSTAFYVYGGHRWAGNNRIVHNIVIGPHDRAISMNRSNFNLIANNTFLGSDGAPIQIGSSFGNVVANNIIEYSPGIKGPGLVTGVSECPNGYYSYAFGPELSEDLSRFSNNLLLPRNGQGTEIPAPEQKSKLATADPFVDRAGFDFRLKPDSGAVGMGHAIPNLAEAAKDKGPDVGALALGEEMRGEKGKFPEIPKWLLEEWPLSKRGQ